MPMKKFIPGTSKHLLLILFLFIPVTTNAALQTNCDVLSAQEIRQNILNQKFTVAACVTDLINLINQYDTNAKGTGYNTFIALQKNNIFVEAQRLDKLDSKNGSLYGVPVVIKDNIDVKGYDTTAGTAALKNNLAKSDAFVVKKIKDAGGIILGKTNMDELAAGVTNNNFLYGPVRNPYDKNMFAGGSSGGTAAAISLGFAPIGLGSDTAGSTRIPASLSGLIGFKPTLSRYSTAGLVPAAPTFDTVGSMARQMNDIILIDNVLSHSQKMITPIELKGLRLGVPREYFYENLDPETKRITEAALTKLSAAGVILVETNIPKIRNLINEESLQIALYEFPRALSQYLKDRNLNLTFVEVIEKVKSSDVKSAFMGVIKNPISDSDYETAKKMGRSGLQLAYKEYFKQNNVMAIIFPTTPLPARPIEGSLETVELNGKQVPIVDIYTRNTIPAVNAGLPAISLPVGLTKNGLPVGIELDGPENQDVELLSIALSIEKLFGALPRPKLQ